MGMTRNHHIDAGQGGQRRRGVLRHRRGGKRADATVRQHHDQMCALTTQGRDAIQGRQQNILNLDFGFQVRLPFGGLGRQKAQHADTDGLGLAVLIVELSLQQNVVLHWQRTARTQVGRDDGKFDPLQRPAQKAQAKAEIVVAYSGGIIAQGVHRGDGRMPLLGDDIALFCQIIAHWTALQCVAIVEQQAISRRLARARDQARRPRQSHPRRWAISKIVISQQMHMQVRGRHDAKFQGTGRLRMGHRRGGFHPA